MKIVFTLFILSALFYTACSKPEPVEIPKVKVVEINTRSVVPSIYTSEFIESARVIPLETTEESLIGDIACVKVKRDMIYVSDMNALYKFDMTGKFVGKLCRQGEEAGCYRNIRGFDVMEDGSVMIFSYPNLMMYDWEGNLMECRTVGYYASDFYVERDSAVLVYGGHSAPEYKVTRLDGRKLENGDLLARDSIVGKYLCLWTTDPAFASAGDSVVFTECHNDTIYSIADGKVSRDLVLKYSVRNVPQAFYKKGYRDIRVFYEALGNTSYVYNLGFYLESESYCMNAYCDKGDVYYAVVGKTDSLNHVTKAIRDDVYLSGYFVQPAYMADASTFISIIDPEILMEYSTFLTIEKQMELRKRVRYVGEGQNPIIYLGRVR